MVLWVTLLLILAPAAWCFGAQAVGTDSGLFSLDAKGEQLGAVLEQIKEKTGYTVSLDKEWLSAPVNVRFEGQQLGSGLQRVFESVGIRSHALKIDKNTRAINVFVVDGQMQNSAGLSDNENLSSVTLYEQSNGRQKMPPGVTPEELKMLTAGGARQGTEIDPYTQPLFPPGDDGDPGMTVGEARDRYESERQHQWEDPLDEPVLPPGLDGTEALTVRELQSMAEPSHFADPLDRPILPPGPDGSPALTVRELKAMEVVKVDEDSLDRAVLPPGPAGTPALTVRDLKLMNREVYGN